MLDKGLIFDSSRGESVELVRGQGYKLRGLVNLCEDFGRTDVIFAVREKNLGNKP